MSNTRKSGTVATGGLVTTGPLFIGCVHVFDNAASAVLERVRPDGRIGKDNHAKIAESIAEKRAALQAENYTTPLRRLNHAVVLSSDERLFECSGMDTAVQLMNFLSALRPGAPVPPGVHPAQLVGFNVEENLSIAAFNSAVDGVIPPYWAWNWDQRAPNWFLDPYKFICVTKEARDLVPLRDVLDRVKYPADVEISSALGAASAARYLSQCTGLCL